MKKKSILLAILGSVLILAFVFTFFGRTIQQEKLTSKNRAITKLSKADLAYFHAGYEYMRLRDPATDRIPENIKSKELAFARTLPSTDEYNNTNDYKFSSGPKTTWQSMGPDNISGRCLAVGIDVMNEDIILAGSASGGLWRSTDGGQSWVKTTPPNVVQSVSCLVQDVRPGKTNTWYYGTGELISTTDRQFSLLPRTMGYGNGIFKSTDNGASWQVLTSTEGGSAGNLSSIFQGIWNLAIDTTNHTQDIVWAACYGAIMKSTDGGNTWEKSLGDTFIKSFSTYVTIAPDGTAYASLGTFSTNTNGLIPTVYGVYRSTDGISWQEITPAGFPTYYRTIKLALAPSNPDVLYILAENPVPDNTPSLGFTNSNHMFWKGVYNNITSSYNWEDRTINIPGAGKGDIMPSAIDPLHGYNSIGGYAMTMKIHPDDEDIVFLGGTNLFRNTTGFSDSTFTKVMGGYPYDGDASNLHPDQHCMAFLPSNNIVLYAANDGGLYRADSCLNDTVLWEHASHGLITTQFYSIAIDHAASDDDFIIGGVQDNAVYYKNSIYPSTDWETAQPGDGFSCVVADNVAFAIGSVYTGNIFSFLFDSQMNMYSDLYQRPDTLGDADFDFYTFFALDPVNNTTFYLPAKNVIWRQDDMAALANDSSLLNVGWNKLSNTLVPPLTGISAICITKSPPNRLYYGTDNGKLYKMDNANTGNPTAVEITGTDFPTNAFIGSIETDPENGDFLLVAFSNYNVRSVFSSDDGGSTWQEQSGNLEENNDGSGYGPSVRSLKILKHNNQNVYFAGTSVGLFSTTDFNGDQTIWLQEGATVIGNIIVDNIDARSTDGLIVIATQGNGVYKAIYEPVSISEKWKASGIVLEQNYPNPANNQTIINFKLPLDGFVELSIYDIAGKVIRYLKNEKMNKGIHTINFNTSNIANGTYFYRLQFMDKALTKKIVIQH